LRGAVTRYSQALELFTKIGDAKEKVDCICQMCWVLKDLGDLKLAEEFSRRLLEDEEQVSAVGPRGVAHYILGLCYLARGAWSEAVDALESAEQLAWARRWILTKSPSVLGRAFLAQKQRDEALRRFQDAIALAEPKGSERERWLPQSFAYALSGLEKAYQDAVAFRAFCCQLREEHPDGEWGLASWYLEPAEAFGFPRCLIHDPFVGSPSPDGAPSAAWVWQDPLGDCCFNTQDGLQVHAANGRDLWHINLSGPRLLRQAPQEGDFAAQTDCGRALPDRPAIGGLLLWQSQENYLRLDRGRFGFHEITFQGCLDNQDVIIGRGRLSQDAPGRVFLRLECMGDHVRALCSADGKEWFTAGAVAFPLEGDVQVGLHAIGTIHRGIYHGAYPDGTAIRFESFTMWALDC
jgi:hypothetical protein